jgi:hypothetical protein
VPYDSELQKLIDEPKLTSKEVADKYDLHPSKVRRIFQDEPGVIRIGHPATRTRKQYYTLRIPLSVVARVFGRMTVRAEELGTKNPLKATCGFGRNSHRNHAGGAA